MKRTDTKQREEDASYEEGEGSHKTRVNVQPQEDKKLATDFQSDITDAGYLKIAFYEKFSGWVAKTKIVPEKILGLSEDKQKKYFDINKTTRYMNEECASMLFADCLPLISRLTTTGTMSDKEIFNRWDGKITSLSFTLLDNYYLEKNTYALRIERIGDIVSYLGTLSAITMKAKAGFTLKEIAESFITTNIFSNRGQEQQQKSEGILDRISGGFFKR